MLVFVQYTDRCISTGLIGTISEKDHMRKFFNKFFLIKKSYLEKQNIPFIFFSKLFKVINTIFDITSKLSLKETPLTTKHLFSSA